MRVLYSSASFALEYGGPAYSVRRLASAVSARGVEAAIWAPDGSAAASGSPGPKDDVVRLDGSLSDALKRFMPDVFHDSGLWLPHNHALASAASARGLPRIVSTRGMLDPWARRHKALKKRLAWLLYQRNDLRVATRLHATSAVEAGSVKALLPGADVDVIPNGIDVPTRATLAAIQRSGPERRVAYLGRLHSVKGLDLLIEAWARVRPLGWVLELAGPSEDDERAKLQALADRLAVGTIRFLGSVSGGRKVEFLATADLVVLPSRSESFGVVVGEALAHGAPVLTTTEVPWPEIDVVGCGWRVAASVDALAGKLDQITKSDKEDLQAMGERGRRLVQRAYSWDEVGARFCRTYQLAAANSVLPLSA